MTRRLFSSTIMILLLCGAGGFAQDRISPLSDFMYNRRDFPRYEEMKEEKDPQKLAALLIEFQQSRPINRLLPFILQDYQAAIVDLMNNQEWDKALAMAEAFQSALPTDKDVEDEEIPVGVEEFMEQLRDARLRMQQVFLNVYYLSGNWAKAAEIQRQLHSNSPTVQSAQLLADIYLKMENYDGYLGLANELMQEFPIDQPRGFDIASQVLDLHLQRGDIPAATQIYRNLMDVYSDRLPEGLTDAQWNPVRATAWMLLAQEPFASKDFQRALEMFENAVKAAPTNGDAWYYIGMIKWQLEGQTVAVEPFARSVVLAGASAASARQFLEQIHKAENEDSLDGLDEVLAKAKADLGI